MTKPTTSQRANIEGNKYGRLTVLSFSHQSLGGSMWNCRCECGNLITVKIGKLTTGWTKSCGCFRKEVTASLTFSHGQARKDQHTKTYERWKGMIQRCTNPKHKGFKDYGGRGITVCDRWMRFENFFSDMGQAPNGRVIDRKNNDGNYEPGNCRWTDYVTSARNRRPRQKL